MNRSRITSPSTIVAVVLRKRMNAEEDSPATPFTLDGLRQMKEAGQLTTEEYERMKAAMIAHYRASSRAKTERENPASSDPSDLPPGFDED